MDIDPEYFSGRKKKAEEIYTAKKSIFNVAIVGSKGIKVRAVLRKVGDGNITFWSVMPYSKFKQEGQRLFTEGIEDE